jgi:acyl carrier protein
MEEIKKTIKEYILKEFLPGQNPEELNDSTPLVTGGILDSVATLRLVAFLESRYDIRILPHETSVDFINTIADIAKLIQSKT